MMNLLKFMHEILDKLMPLNWFLPRTLLLYVGLIISKRIAAIPLGTITLILTPLFLLPLYYWEEFDPAWYIKVALWFILFILGIILKSIHEVENEHIQHVREKRTKKLQEQIVMSADPKRLPIYFLFLKPFALKHLDTQIKEHFDLEDILRSALYPIHLISLEKPSETIGTEQTFIPNPTWQADFEKFAVHAKSILVIPSDYPSMVWEIKWLVENKLLPSCIWLMPETPGWSKTYVNYEIPSTEVFTVSEEEEGYDYAVHWNEAIKALQELGIKLPPYQARGMFFVIDNNGTASAFQPLALSPIFLRVRKIRRELKNLRDPAKSSQEDPYAPPSEPTRFSKVKETLPFTIIGVLLIGYGLFQEFHNGFSWSMLFIIAFGAAFLFPLIDEIKGSRTG